MENDFQKDKLDDVFSDLDDKEATPNTVNRNASRVELGGLVSDLDEGMSKEMKMNYQSSMDQGNQVMEGAENIEKSSRGFFIILGIIIVLGVLAVFLILR